MIRWLIAATIVAAWSSSNQAHAAQVAFQFPAQVASSAGTYAAKGALTFSGAAANAPFMTQVAGKAVTVPASWRLASNAASFAVSAVRLNPAALVGTAVASWLIGYGLEWVNDQWMKKGTQVGTLTWDGNYWTDWQVAYWNQPTPFATAEAACQAYTQATNRTYRGVAMQANTAAMDCLWRPVPDSWPNDPDSKTGMTPARKSTGTSTAPATESDWDAPKAAALPDTAASELTGKGVAIPLTPDIPTAPVTTPLGDPYTDPVTGKRYQDKAYITPSVTSPGTGDLQVVSQEVDASGNTATDPATGQPKAPEQNKDECLEHPDRLACLDVGKIPDAPELGKDERNISIAPQAGWGADTAACPADLTASFLGKPVAFSFGPVCTAADSFRPIVIGLAWLTAVLVAMGMARKEA